MRHGRPQEDSHMCCLNGGERMGPCSVVRAIQASHKPSHFPVRLEHSRWPHIKVNYLSMHIYNPDFSKST